MCVLKLCWRIPQQLCVAVQEHVGRCSTAWVEGPLGCRAGGSSEHVSVPCR